MTSMDRKGLVALDRKAATWRKVWLRDREERRAMQFADNAQIRRRWLESDSPPDEPESACPHREEDEVVPIQS